MNDSTPSKVTMYFMVLQKRLGLQPDNRSETTKGFATEWLDFGISKQKEYVHISLTIVKENGR